MHNNNNISTRYLLVPSCDLFNEFFIFLSNQSLCLNFITLAIASSIIFQISLKTVFLQQTHAFDNAPKSRLDDKFSIIAKSIASHITAICVCCLSFVYLK